MSKGTILEMENDSVLVMTGDCDFINLKRKPGMFVGQQVQFTPIDIKKERKPVKFLMPLIASAAAIIFIVFLFFIFFQKSSDSGLEGIYSFVDLDINPSIELMLDKDNKVQKTLSLNDDAQKLLKGLDFNNMYLEKAITEILAKSEDLGYIDMENNHVLASVSLNDEYTYYGKDIEEQKNYIDDLVRELKISLEDKTDKYLVTKASPILKRKASKNNLSIGRQTYYESMRKNDEDITIDEAKVHDVSTMIENLRGYDNGDESDDTKTPDRVTPTAKGNLKPTSSLRASSTPNPTPKNTATPKLKPTPTAIKVVYDNNTLHISGSVKSGKVLLKWTPMEDQDFQYYKVVISKGNSKPKYPDDGYMYVITDINASSISIDKYSQYNGGDFGGKIIPGEKYYFAITAVFKNKKIHSNAVSMKYPGTPTSTPTPKPSTGQKLTAKVGSDSINLSWTPNTRSGFVYYKVVISKTNPHPVYPEDGYMWYSTNETSYVVRSSNGYNGGDFNGQLISGQKYYFSITYVYNDTKITSNTLYLTYP
ncbi:MAG TPA: anti-sigma factor domain-containing protein [Pseudobacteroides sp.]|uniref:anti-sigma factor domain-containing protein n=1 Tax=Pseudobacteroides sp. TaxID=1968840 RepID=UPI002F9430B8